MKTEPTEAMRERIKKLFEITAEDVTAIEANARRNEIIALAAFKKGQSSPKIKQLEWEESDGEYWEAITRIGTYSITFDSGSYVTLYDMDNDVDGEWKSLAKAKIACNNDFEKRVMDA